MFPLEALKAVFLHILLDNVFFFSHTEERDLASARSGALLLSSFLLTVFWQWLWPVFPSFRMKSIFCFFIVRLFFLRGQRFCSCFGCCFGSHLTGQMQTWARAHAATFLFIVVFSFCLFWGVDQACTFAVALAWKFQSPGYFFIPEMPSASYLTCFVKPEMHPNAAGCCKLGK